MKGTNSPHLSSSQELVPIVLHMFDNQSSPREVENQALFNKGRALCQWRTLFWLPGILQCNYGKISHVSLWLLSLLCLFPWKWNSGSLRDGIWWRMLANCLACLLGRQNWYLLRSCCIDFLSLHSKLPQTLWFRTSLTYNLIFFMSKI